MEGVFSKKFHAGNNFAIIYLKFLDQLCDIEFSIYKKGAPTVILHGSLLTKINMIPQFWKLVRYPYAINSPGVRFVDDIHLHCSSVRF
jgi:hypothetical protein